MNPVQDVKPPSPQGVTHAFDPFPLAFYYLSEPRQAHDRVIFGAALNGQLLLVEHCLLVGHGTEGVQPVFPYDLVSWNRIEQRLVFRGQTYSLGDEISLAGGYFGDRKTIEKRTNVKIPSCGEAPLFIVS